MGRFHVSFTVDAPNEQSIRAWLQDIEFGENGSPRVGVAENRFGESKRLNIHDLKVGAKTNLRRE